MDFDPLENDSSELLEAVEAMGGHGLLAAIDELVRDNEEHTVEWFDTRLGHDLTANEVIHWSIAKLAKTAPTVAMPPWMSRCSPIRWTTMRCPAVRRWSPHPSASSSVRNSAPTATSSTSATSATGSCTTRSGSWTNPRRMPRLRGSHRERPV